MAEAKSNYEQALTHLTGPQNELYTAKAQVLALLAVADAIRESANMLNDTFNIQLGNLATSVQPTMKIPRTW